MLFLPHFALAFVLRSVAAWILMRACLAGISMIAAVLAKRPPPENPFLVAPVPALMVVGVIVLVGWQFARLRNEDLFLASIGVRRVQMLGLLAAPGRAGDRRAARCESVSY